MRVVAIGMLAALVLSGCGTATGDRGLSGAGIGAGIGSRSTHRRNQRMVVVESGLLPVRSFQAW